MVVISIGYDEYVFSREDAMTMIGLLEKAERYEQKYWNKEERAARGITSEYTYHVYPNDKQNNMKIINNDLYQMAKLAGKPEKD